MKQLILAVALCATAAHATYYDGNELLNRLNSEDSGNRMLALGFIAGVSDSTRGRFHCIPNNVQLGQIRDMVRNYLTNTPAERHFSAHSIVREILREVFPCNTGGKSL